MTADSYRGFLDAEEAQQSATFRLSFTGDVAIPLAVALIPTCIFAMAGFLLEGANQPKAQIPIWLALAIGGLQVAGTVAMAVVVLLRLEAFSKRLTLMSNGPPAQWRKLSMLTSIGCLTLFDILFNVGGMFQGASFLWYVACPMFLLYLLIIQVAFIGLQQSTAATLAE